MEELDLLKKLERVKAPPDFEEKLYAQIPARREKRLRARNLRLSLAGAASVFFVAVLLVNIFLFRGQEAMQEPMKIAEIEKETPVASSVYKKAETLRHRDTIPIIEAVDFNKEIRSVSRQPQTIYILEQVSDTKRDKIKF